MKKEIWKDIPNYEGYYQASDLGRVKSLNRCITDLNGKRVRVFKECILKAGLAHGYRTVNLCRKNYKVSVIIMMAFKDHVPCGMKVVVDHVNGIKTDDRLVNLQLISQRENVSRSKKGTSKYVGVSWNKRKSKWYAYIRINGKNIYLGSFTNEIEASKAYQKKLRELNQISV